MLVYLAQILAFVFGVVWCGAILKRFPADLREFRASPGGESRPAILTYWIITIPILLWVLGFGWILLSGFFRLLG